MSQLLCQQLLCQQLLCQQPLCQQPLCQQPLCRKPRLQLAGPVLTAPDALPRPFHPIGHLRSVPAGAFCRLGGRGGETLLEVNAMRTVHVLYLSATFWLSCDFQPAAEPVIPEPMGAASASIPVPDSVPRDSFALPEGLETLPSGLQYYEERTGTGFQAKLGQKVTIHYSGWLVDGTELDTSRRPGRTPATFPLGSGDEIQGWTEGIARMRVGGASWLVVPPELGYGSMRGGLIPPDSTLVYRIELYAVK